MTIRGVFAADMAKQEEGRTGKTEDPRAYGLGDVFIRGRRSTFALPKATISHSQVILASHDALGPTRIDRRELSSSLQAPHAATQNTIFVLVKYQAAAPPVSESKPHHPSRSPKCCPTGKKKQLRGSGRSYKKNGHWNANDSRLRVGGGGE